MVFACQVLRYNQSQAYVVHYDYLESAEGHDFKSEGLGTNRFATVSARRNQAFVMEFGTGSAQDDRVSVLTVSNGDGRLFLCGLPGRGGPGQTIRYRV